MPLPARRSRGLLMRGFTLIELLVTMAVLAIIMSLAAPSFNDALLGNRLTSYANSFIASAQLARSEAIKRNAAVTMCRSANGSTCASSGGWEQGWIVMQGSTVIQQQQALTAGFQMTGTAYTLQFQSSGVGATAASLTLCKSSPDVGSQERVITVAATGRASVSTTKTGSCT